MTDEERALLPWWHPRTGITCGEFDERRRHMTGDEVVALLAEIRERRDY